MLSSFSLIQKVFYRYVKRYNVYAKTIFQPYMGIYPHYNQFGRLYAKINWIIIL